MADTLAAPQTSTSGTQAPTPATPSAPPSHVQSLNVTAGQSLESHIATNGKTQPNGFQQSQQPSTHHAANQPRNEHGQFVQGQPQQQPNPNSGQEGGEQTQVEGQQQEGQQQVDDPNQQEGGELTFETTYDPAQIERLSGELGIPINSLENVNLLERLLQRELDGQGQPGQQQTQQGQQQAPPADGLTEFERRMIAAAASRNQPNQQGQQGQQGNPNSGGRPQQQDQSQQQQLQQDPTGQNPVQQGQPYIPPYPQLNDIGRDWKSPMDGTMALQAEYQRLNTEAAMYAQQGREYVPDYSRINDIQNAMMDRKVVQHLPALAQILVGHLAQHIPNFITEQLTPIQQQLAPMNQHFAAQRTAEIQRFAVEQLKSVPGLEGIDEMFKPTSSAMLKFKDPRTGQEGQFADTPMNRILIQNPELLNIEISADPENGVNDDAARISTLIQRYRPAAKIYFGGKLNPKTAAKLVQSGVQQAQSQQSQATRHKLNANGNNGTNGPGSNGNPNSNGRGKSLVAELNEATGGKSLQDIGRSLRR